MTEYRPGDRAIFLPFGEEVEIVDVTTRPLGIEYDVKLLRARKHLPVTAVELRPMTRAAAE